VLNISAKKFSVPVLKGLSLLARHSIRGRMASGVSEFGITDCPQNDPDRIRLSLNYKAVEREDGLMRIRGMIKAGLAAVLVLGTTALSSWAGEPVFLLLHGDQDALVLGTVVAATPEMLKFQPAVELPGQKRWGVTGFPLGAPLQIRQTNGGQLSHYQSPLAVGDRAIVSLRAEDDHYRLAWGAFHVSSLDLATLRVSKLEKSSDLIMLQWYLNSCAREKEFAFDGGTVFVQSGGQKRPIGIQQNKSWVALAHPQVSCGPLKGLDWVGPWEWLAVGGLLAVLLGIVIRVCLGTGAGKI
jgi:hypothetical protein